MGTRRCKLCGRCCRLDLVVEVFPCDDVPEDFTEVDMLTYVSATVFSPGLHSPTVMRRNADGACVALGADGRCTIYRRRPAVCRAYEPGHESTCAIVLGVPICDVVNASGSVPCSS